MKLRILSKACVLATFICCSVTAAYGQSPANFSALKESDLTMRTYDQDTSASAVVLSDIGYSYYTRKGNFKLVHERQTRIKILKKSGYDYANIHIPYYQLDGGKEKILNLEGYTYNLENGQIRKDKLEEKEMYEDQKTKNWFVKKIAMPNVKEGSVVEFSYTITSDFLFNLRSWEFQSTIPVVHSEYKVQLPEYFDFKQEHQGYLGFDMQKSGKAVDKYMTTGAVNAPGIRHNGKAYHWVVKDAPALRLENHITTIRDYQSRIDFELLSIKNPGYESQVMAGDWEHFTKELLAGEKFGDQLHRRGYFRSEVTAIVAKYDKPEQQMAAVHQLVKNRVKWNGWDGFGPTGPLRKAYDKGTGNVGDINLMLIAMLLDAGIDAAPVLVSTRENGRIPLGLPMLSKFNYVVAHVMIDGKQYLLDATDPLLPAGMLPFRCLNGHGRLIKKTDQRWIELQTDNGASNFFNRTIAINEKGEIAGEAYESMGGYSALALRKTIQEEGKEKYVEHRSKETGEITMTKPTIANLEQVDKPLELTYHLKGSGNGLSNDVLYINPMFGYGEKENPFKLEERLYPVDFATASDETYQCTITFPAGYEVEEAPKGAIVTLPENGGKFIYMVEKQQNAIVILSRITISKPVFYAPEYAYLREFYNQIVAKQAEQIVLKKSTMHLSSSQL